MRSGFSSHSTPLRIGRLSSVLTAYDRVPNQLAHIGGFHAPAVTEANRGELREIILRQAVQLELRAAALEADLLLARGLDLDRIRRELARQFLQFLRRNGDAALSLDVRLYFVADMDVEIGSGEANPALRGFDQDIRQDRQRRLAGDAGSDRRQPFLEFFTRDRESHQLLGVH